VALVQSRTAAASAQTIDQFAFGKSGCWPAPAGRNISGLKPQMENFGEWIQAASGFAPF
jgi:hypothetical protein